MGLENIEQVDAIGIEAASGAAILQIVDSWSWDDTKQHLDALRKKLGAYFDFIDSGQVFSLYPHAKGRKLCINVNFRFPLPDEAQRFLKQVSEMAAEAKIELRPTHVN
jgi:hypothetical protein